MGEAIAAGGAGAAGGAAAPAAMDVIGPLIVPAAKAIFSLLGSSGDSAKNDLDAIQAAMAAAGAAIAHLSDQTTQLLSETAQIIDGIQKLSVEMHASMDALESSLQSNTDRLNKLGVEVSQLTKMVTIAPGQAALVLIEGDLANYNQALATLFPVGAPHQKVEAHVTPDGGHMPATRRVSFNRPGGPQVDISPIFVSLASHTQAFFDAENLSGMSFAVLFPRIQQAFPVEYHLSKICGVTDGNLRSKVDAYLSFTNKVVDQNAPGSYQNIVNGLVTVMDNWTNAIGRNLQNVAGYVPAEFNAAPAGPLLACLLALRDLQSRETLLETAVANAKAFAGMLAAAH